MVHNLFIMRHYIIAATLSSRLSFLIITMMDSGTHFLYWWHMHLPFLIWSIKFFKISLAEFEFKLVPYNWWTTYLVKIGGTCLFPPPLYIYIYIYIFVLYIRSLTSITICTWYMYLISHNSHQKCGHIVHGHYRIDISTCTYILIYIRSVRINLWSTTIKSFN